MLNFENVLSVKELSPYEKIMAGNENLLKVQLNDKIVDDLRSYVKSLREIKNPESKDNIKILKRISSSLHKRFGVPVKITKTYGGYYSLPVAYTNNVIEYYMTTNEKNTYKPNDKLDALIIDTENVYVENYNLKKKATINIDFDILLDEKYTVDENVAIILHEMGHIFTFLSNTSRMVYNTTLLIDAFSYATSGENNKYKKIVTNEFGVKDPDNKKEVIVKGTKKFTDDVVRLGSVFQTSTDAENLADSFVVTFGLGDSLASGLNKLIKDIDGTTKQLEVLFVFNFIAVIIVVLQNLIRGYILILTPMFFVHVIIYLIIILIRISLINILFDSLSIVNNKLNNSIRESLNAMFILLSLDGTLPPIYIKQNGTFPYGKLIERITKIKTTTIKNLRTNKLSKEEIKDVVNQIDGIIKTINLIKEDKRDLTITALIASENYGQQFNLENVTDMLLDKLENNDLHYLAAKVASGNESINDDIAENGNIYINVVQDKFMSYHVTNALNLTDKETFLPKLNNVLINYKLNLNYNDRDKTYILKSNVQYKINTNGISGLVLIPILDEKKDIKDNTVIQITLDSNKVTWLLNNPYVKVYNIDSINLYDNKYIYILRMEYLDTEIPTKYNNTLNKISDIVNEYFYEYGKTTIDKEITYLLSEIKETELKIPNELFKQFKILQNIVTGKTKYSNSLDLHRGNYGVNTKKELVLLDPLYDSVILASKTNNKVTIDKSMLDKE